MLKSMLVVPMLVAGLSAVPTCLVLAAESSDDSEQADTANQQPFLGVVVREVNESRFDSVPGLQVERVVQGQTADQLGLKAGDILQSLNGTELATRADLSKVLATAQVGEEVTASWMSENEARSGRTILKGKLSRREIGDRLRVSREQLEDLEAARASQLDTLEDMQDQQADLAESLMGLKQTLEALPEQLQAVANEFKAVYPDGVFDVQVSINIKTDAGDSALDLSPRPPQSEPELADQADQDGDSEAAAQGDEPAEYDALADGDESAEGDEQAEQDVELVAPEESQDTGPLPPPMVP